MSKKTIRLPSEEPKATTPVEGMSRQERQQLDATMRRLLDLWSLRRKPCGDLFWSSVSKLFASIGKQLAEFDKHRMQEKEALALSYTEWLPRVYDAAKAELRPVRRKFKGKKHERALKEAEKQIACKMTDCIRDGLVHHGVFSPSQDVTEAVRECFEEGLFSKGLDPTKKIVLLDALAPPFEMLEETRGSREYADRIVGAVLLNATEKTVQNRVKALGKAISAGKAPAFGLDQRGGPFDPPWWFAPPAARPAPLDVLALVDASSEVLEACEAALPASRR